MRFIPLASGSKGNCLYLETEETTLLIDAGLNRKQTLLRLEQIGVSIDAIDAILITHGHTDHIQGARLLSLKHNIPLIANLETAKEIIAFCGETLPFKIFTTGETFAFGDIEVHPFSIQHDTMDPVGFAIQTPHHKLGICADTGMITNAILHALKDTSLLYLEANHEPEWVHACSRPPTYKQRVLSRTGHLSNQSCGEALAELAHGGLQQVYLAHLSEECNSPDKALDVVQNMLAKYSIELPLEIAHQHKPSLKS